MVKNPASAAYKCEQGTLPLSSVFSSVKGAGYTQLIMLL